MKTPRKRTIRIAAALAALMLTAASAVAEEGSIAVKAPEGYEQGSPLPLYRAMERNQKQQNFFDKVDPAWFNQSGVLSTKNGSKRARYDHIVFQDEAQLSIDVNVVSYGEYDGSERMIYGEDPENPSEPFPRVSFAHALGDLAGWAYIAQRETLGLSDAPPKLTLEKRELNGLTLEAAEAQVQALLQKLGMEGYRTVYALDMSLEHIRILGEYEEKKREEYYNKNTGWWDFSQATEADQGFYLELVKEMDGVPIVATEGVAFYTRAFVDAQGVRLFTLCDTYAIGEVYDTPDRLLTAAEALEAFAGGNARREKDGIGQPVATGAKLCYTVARARNKKAGMVLEPAWYITYDWLDVTQEMDGWAFYSAVDGRLIEDCYEF